MTLSKPLPEIKPCPFCGKTPRFSLGKNDGGEITKHYRYDGWRMGHRCPVIGVISIGGEWILSPEQIAERWNKRAEVKS